MPHIALSFVAFALALNLAPPPVSKASRQVVVTVDDLPVVTRVFADDAGRERITSRLVSAITRQHVPAVGFVNEGKMYRDGAVQPTQVALLRQWVDAGLELGNHSYSHFDLHTTDATVFIRDALAGDSITRAVMARAGRQPRYFRHPFLHTGRDLTTRAHLDDSLTAHGYRVAPVTIDNSDYVFATAYERALGSRDSAGARRIGDEYLEYMTQVFAYYERQSVTLVGREIPQVLLIHASALNADTFDRMASMMRARGYAFVTLDAALADSAYRSADTYVGPAGITWLHRWALTRGLRGAVFAGEPEVPAHIAAAAR
ncbi:MAG TPA: polysaccharide deacetylase family protein [Gemmatimonadaceae bacterium]|nr:polysaccharide deacetylase family protein [Gemmatimonadaceae bacterium]